ncbi:potassium voltage-gated channel subfamily E regulatory beta subunit 5 [Spea bombifrons]|uniref:potassium voltage-gated channel subfamily E regulatory beta subunit 5 n=1 Tax=Spea bombifrons TaxID=233779 RepID=UPI00234ADEB1|nr:potassium voltage-gated channel subfamily E regulatory beta subunit 5 [Spea bombifrons]
MSLPVDMNCSDTARLKTLLTQLLKDLAQANGTTTHTDSNDTDDAYLYILLIMIFYACLAGGLILAYTRSKKMESKTDPYHLYIESEWAKNRRNVPCVSEHQQRGSIESEHLL